MSHLLSTFPSQPTFPGVVHCNGPFIYTDTGRRILDLTSGGTAFALMGWNHPSVNSAIIQQLSKYTHLDYKTYDDPNREKLALMLTASQSSLDYCFLSGGSGAEACEMAIHMSYQQHCEEGNSQKTTFISRKQSYHGATSMALALSERPNLSFYSRIHPQNIVRVSEPNYHRNKHLYASEDEYCKFLIDEFLRVVYKIGSGNIAAFVAETCLGGLVGDVPPPRGYWEQIRNICTDFNIHLILDEVWFGTGISGKYNCYEYDNIKPDFLFLGKTLCCGYVPLSAVLVTSRFRDIILSNSARINTSCTFQGHSLACAAAIEVQKYLSSSKTLDHISRQGDLIRKELSSLLELEQITDVRGRGLRNSLEYSIDHSNLFGQYISSQMLNKHSIIVSGKWHRLSLCNAVNIPDDIITQALQLLKEEIVKALDVWPTLDKDTIGLRHVY